MSGAALSLEPDANSASLQSRTTQFVFVALALWFLGIATYIVHSSLHWPMVHDAPILLYMNFLKDHGLRLYRDVIEVQFPGSLLLYVFSDKVFGSSNLGFRLFDLFAFAVAAASGLTIVFPRRGWFAAAFATILFLMVHAATQDSIAEVGQRDFIATAILATGVASLLEAERRQFPWLATLFGFALAFSVFIKPTAAVFIAPFCFITISLHRHGLPLRPYLTAFCAGSIGGIAVVISFLLHNQALASFIELQRTLVPLYAHITPVPYLSMLRDLAQPLRPVWILVAVAACIAAFSGRLRRDPLQRLLLLCAFCGLACYLLQHKGFFYHRYPLYFFLFLWMSWVFVCAVQFLSRRAAFCLLAMLAIFSALMPHFVHMARPDGWTERMQADMAALGGFDTPRSIQCIDITEGCTTALLRTHTVEATGYLSDYLFFFPAGNRPIDPRLNALRIQFLNALDSASPRMIVIPNNEWPVYNHLGYEKLRNWPEFAAFLSEHYNLALERGGMSAERRGYRIYIRSPDLQNTSYPQLR